VELPAFVFNWRQRPHIAAKFVFIDGNQHRYRGVQMPQVPTPLPPTGDVSARLKMPAMAVLAIGVFGIVQHLAMLAAHFLAEPTGRALFGTGLGYYYYWGPVGLTRIVLGAVVSCVVVLGGMQMRRVGSYRVALLGAVLAMLPGVGPCCVIGLPIGIWGGITLIKPDVKCGFKNN
jgi:hypothetical protein